MGLRRYDEIWLKELCENSFSLAEVLRKAGRKIGGGNQTTLKNKIEEYQIDISHFTGQAWSKGKTKESDDRISSREIYSKEDIFKKDSDIARTVVRKYIIKYNWIPYECACCGNKGEWLGQKLSLQLDHINGINNDNREENLRFLCPNCHSMTETFSGKNRKQNFSDEEIKEVILKSNSASQVLRKLGLSVNGINIYKIKLLAMELDIKYNN